eukprot:Colp12_sorted_trinity150504_noHs@17027
MGDGSRTEIQEQKTVDLLKDKKTVAIYYSASWCGPCRQFTPILEQFYADMNKKGKKFEIVWASRDSTAEDFVSYYKKMPWLAVSTENIDKCLEATSTKFAVRGIPYLVLLDGADGSVYTLDGRGKLSQDPYGLEFPWRPRTPGAILKRIVPASVSTLIANQIGGVKQRFVAALQSVLSKFAPGRLILKLFGRK